MPLDTKQLEAGRVCSRFVLVLRCSCLLLLSNQQGVGTMQTLRAGDSRQFISNPDLFGSK